MKRIHALVVSLLLVVPALAAPRAVVSFAVSSYAAQGGEFLVAVKVPEGERLKKPRIALIPAEEALPPNGSKAWTEFPEITAGEELLTLIAPRQKGKFWLLLKDGNTLLARAPFDVVDTETALEHAKAALRAQIAQLGDSSDRGSSKNGWIAVQSAGSVGPGELVEVVVTLPPGLVRNKGMVLAWGDTTKLSWNDKGLESRDLGSVTVQGTASSESVSIPAPNVADAYDLRLFHGADLLDVLPLIVR